MEISLSKKFKNSPFHPGSFQKTFTEIVTSVEGNPSEVFATAHYQHSNDFSETRRLTLEDLGSIVSIGTHPSRISVTVSDTLAIVFSTLFEQLQVHIMGSDASQCSKVLTFLASNLRLESAEPTRFGHMIDATTSDENSSRILSLPDSHIVSSKIADTNPSKNVSTIPYPSKLTLEWLVKHAPLSFWFWLIAIIGGAFALGVQLADIPIINKIFGKN